MNGGYGWWSQPFRPDGGIAAEGLRNQLGRPSLSVLTVLVREAAQNSWDARLAEGDVRFTLEFGQLDPVAREAWRSALDPGAPASPVDDPALRSLSDYLSRESVPFLAVSDRGATGLGGPTRSDEPAPPGGRGWLSFVLNSGERRDVDGGGGTYGFGKGAFFLASRVGTVLIYTRFRDLSGLRSRLIGSALLHQEDLADPPLTGRHWWGRPQQDYCAPLEDEWADAAAAALGLPAFTADETGTTVVVLDPDLGAPGSDDGRPMTLDEAAQLLADAAALSLWPIMMRDRAQRMSITIKVDGTSVAVPDETNDEVIRAYATAYRKARGADGVAVACERPKAQLGRIAHEVVVHTKTRGNAAVELGLPIDQAPHHAALLRAADLVVGYLPGPQRLDPAFGYAAVFRADDAMDHVFAAAEPPTHDDWVPDQLAGRERTYIRVARRRIEAYCNVAAGAVRSTPSGSTGSVGRLSRHLGFLMDAVTLENGAVDPFDTPGSRGSDSGGSGQGVGEKPGQASGVGNGRRSGRLRLEGPPSFTEYAGRTLLAQRVTVVDPTNARAVVQVVTAEGAEQRSPAAADRPEIVGWQLGDGSLLPGEAALLPAGVVTLLIKPVEDAALEYTVSAS